MLNVFYLLVVDSWVVSNWVVKGIEICLSNVILFFVSL